MSNCMTCFGRGTVIGGDGQPKPCPNPACDAPASSTDELAATFTNWHRQYNRMVLRVAVAQLRREDAAMAEDIAQETWLRLWAYAVGGARVERPACLLAAITRRAASDHYRQVAAHKRPKAIATDYTEPSADRLSPACSAEDVASARLAARDRLDQTTTYGKRHAQRRTERLLALAVSA